MIPKINSMTLAQQVAWVLERSSSKSSNLDQSKINFILGSILRGNDEPTIPDTIAKLPISQKFVIVGSIPEYEGLLSYWLNQWITILGDENINDESSWSWPTMLSFFPGHKLPKPYLG